MTIRDRLEQQCILIISGDADLARVWKANFENRNFLVICESTARSGLASARILSPALILLGINLPDEEQLDLCRELRSTTDGALLLLDPNNKNPDVLEYHHAGVDETISASINPMALMIKSLAWLAKYDWTAPYKSFGHMRI